MLKPVTTVACASCSSDKKVAREGKVFPPPHMRGEYRQDGLRTGTAGVAEHLNCQRIIPFRFKEMERSESKVSEEMVESFQRAVSTIILDHNLGVSRDCVPKRGYL
jgi:hypothetical protein